ncbi:hypothetical protein LNP74_05105 [Klebsiella pneumoniae subsp. pneumoniae]|nr:hypothetical protein [Klebsiella pneumoniae subsp. pneumoniae]
MGLLIQPSSVAVDVGRQEAWPSMHHRILGVDARRDRRSFMMLNRVAAAGFFSAQALLAATRAWRVLTGKP